jgi:hypothetical protein
MKAKERKEKAILAVEQLEKRLAQGSSTLQEALARLQPRKGRGGLRPGAGRPTKGEAPASERVIFRLTPEEAALLDKFRQLGESTNQTARRVLLETLVKTS